MKEIEIASAQRWITHSGLSSLCASAGGTEESASGKVRLAISSMPVATSIDAMLTIKPIFIH